MSVLQGNIFLLKNVTVLSNFKFTLRFIIFELKIMYVYFTCMVNLLACEFVYQKRELEPLELTRIAENF